MVIYGYCVNNVLIKLVKFSKCLYSLSIGVRNQFRLGGLRSVARIFFPLHARKSSGFARILPDVLPEYGYLEYLEYGYIPGGLQPPSPPPPPPPASYAYEFETLLRKSCSSNSE